MVTKRAIIAEGYRLGGGVFGEDPVRDRWLLRRTKAALGAWITHLKQTSQTGTGDPQRVDIIVAKLRLAWGRCPDLRLCQLLSGLLEGNQSHCLFFVEDSVVEAALDKEIFAI